MISSRYRAPRTLLVRFADDPIDETALIYPVLSSRGRSQGEISDSRIQSLTSHKDQAGSGVILQALSRPPPPPPSSPQQAYLPYVGSGCT